MQVILQLNLPSGVWCAGFDRLAIPRPAFITISSAATPAAENVARTLFDELVRHLRHLGPNAAVTAMPDCLAAEQSAFADDARHKLLIWVGDNVPLGQPAILEPFHSRMLAKDPLWSVLPVFNRALRTSVWSLLAPDYRHLNVAFYRDGSDVTELVPSVFATAGLAPAHRRIFISYRHNETTGLAMQIFDALAHAGFEPFLDNFRIPPGVDFQSRLTQELGDKAVVVVLESPGILDSEWTLYEINTARKWRLGLFAVHLPGGRKVPGIDDSARYFLHPHHARGVLAQLTGFSLLTELTDHWRDHLVDWIRTEHDRVLAFRREYLQNAMREALEKSGVPPAATQVDVTGVLHVSPRPVAPDYMIWLATRPPEVADFFSVHTRCKVPDRGVLVGLAELMERDRRQIHDWLGGVCGLVTVDEGRMLEAAGRIAQGTL